MKKARKAMETQMVGLLGTAMERAPWVSCRRVGSWMGLAFFYGFQSRRIIAMDNLRRVYPNRSQRDIARLARRSAQNFGMSFCEFLHLGAASPAEIREFCQWQGYQHIEEALRLGHGVMLPTAHFGAWEVMGARAAQDFPLTVVVRLTSNAALKAHIEGVRRKINVNMILKSDSARAALGVLHSNGALAIFPDQHAGTSGTSMPIFGHPTQVYDSPARLALAAGAPIVPTFGVRQSPWISKRRIVIRAAPALPLRAQMRAQKWSRDEAVSHGTRYILDEIEKIVRAYPEQWLWMHKRWREGDLRASQAAQAQQTTGQTLEQTQRTLLEAFVP